MICPRYFFDSALDSKELMLAVFLFMRNNTVEAKFKTRAATPKACGVSPSRSARPRRG